MYRIVAVDSRSRRDGKYLEKVGLYNPLPDPVELEIDKEKAMKWLNRGAIPSDTVKSFLQRKGIMFEWDLRKRGYDDEKIDEELKKWEIMQLERQKRLEAQAAMKIRQENKKEDIAEEAAEEPEEAVVEPKEAVVEPKEAVVQPEEAVAEPEEAVSETTKVVEEAKVEASEEPAENEAEVEPEAEAEDKETKES